MRVFFWLRDVLFRWLGIVPILGRSHPSTIDEAREAREAGRVAADAWLKHRARRA